MAGNTSYPGPAAASQRERKHINTRRFSFACSFPTLSCQLWIFFNSQFLFLYFVHHVVHSGPRRAPVGFQRNRSGTERMPCVLCVAEAAGALWGPPGQRLSYKGCYPPSPPPTSRRHAPTTINPIMHKSQTLALNLHLEMAWDGHHPPRWDGHTHPSRCGAWWGGRGGVGRGRRKNAPSSEFYRFDRS